MLFLFSACFPAANNVTVRMIEKKRTFKAKPAAEVQVVSLEEAAEWLPEGFFWTGPQRDEVMAEPNFPTADDPNLVLAEYSYRQRQESDDPGPQIAALREKAAADGVDALIVDVKKTHIRAFALHLSSASVEVPPAKPATELLAELKASAESKGYSHAEEPIEKRLDAIEPLAIAGKRGTCYWLSFALDEQASFSKTARRGLDYEMSSGELDIRALAGSLATMRGGKNTIPLEVRSAGAFVGCPQADGELGVELQTLDARDANTLADLDQGAVFFQLHTKSITDAELAERKTKLSQTSRTPSASLSRMRMSFSHASPVPS